MAINKVVFGNTTLMDITDSTVTSSDLKQGITAYGSNGIKLTGNFDPNAYALEKIEDKFANIELEELSFTKTNGSYINWRTGEVVSSSSYAYTNYIDISLYAYLVFTRIGVTNSYSALGAAFYDENQTFIQGAPTIMCAAAFEYIEDRIDVPEGAKYVRFTILKDTTTYGNFVVYGQKETASNLYPIQKASGNIITITDGGNNIPVKSCKVIISATQDGTGTPTPENIRPIRSYTGCNITKTNEDISDIENIQNKTIYNVDWENIAGRVASGMLDITNGTLTVHRLFKRLTSTNPTWTRVGGSGSGLPYFRGPIVAANEITGSDSDICSHYGRVSVASTNQNIGFGSSASRGAVFLRPAGISTLADFKTWLDEQEQAGTPVECLCYLTNPLVYQLTPVQITTLLGLNHIWADCGFTEMEYINNLDSWSYIQSLKTLLTT